LLKGMVCADKSFASVPATTVQLQDPIYKHIYSPQV